MNKIITDLSSGRNYEVRVRSRSGDSYSEWSPVLPISSEETKKAALPNPVSSVTVLDPEGNNTGTTFVGQWGVPTVLDLDFSRYQYQWGYSPYLEANFFPVKPLETTAETASLTIEQNRAIFGSSPKATLELRVRTVDTSGNVSAWVTSSAAVNDAPAAPTSLSATPAIDTISFFWTAPADNDIDYYELHSGTAGFTPGAGTLIAISSDTNFAYTTTTYTTRVFAVRAVDKFGTPGAKSGEVSSAASQSNNSDITAPPTPTGLSLSAGTPSQSLASINVSWNSVYASANDVSIYKVRYSTSTSGPWTYIPVDARTSASADITSAVISSLAPSSTYYVQIAAADKSGNISAYTASSSITTAKNTTAPSTPAPPTAAANGMQIQVSHDNTKAAPPGGPIESDVIGYEVYAGTSIGTYTKIGFLPRSTTTSALFSVTSTGGASTQLWYVNVKAVNSSNISSNSASTDAQASPTLIAAANIVNATIGDAQIDNLNVNKLVSGTISANDIKIGTNGITIDGVSKTIESNGFSTGSTGWQINSDDSAEFNNLTVRNTFKIEDGVTPVTISAYSRTAGNSNTTFTASGHGYSTGDYVLISGTTNAAADTGLTPMVITWLSNNTFSGHPNSATTVLSVSTSPPSSAGSAVKVDNTVRLTNDGLTIGNSGSGVVSIGPTSFQIRSSSTGTRTAIDNTGISVYKSDDPVVSLKSDGTFSLKSTASGTSLVLDGSNGMKLSDSTGNDIVKLDKDGLAGNSKPIPIETIGTISATISSLSATPLASQSATITSAKTLESGNFLYTADNSFNVGQAISISGLSIDIYNNSPAFITSADSSSFQIAHDLLKSSITSITASATGGDPSNEGLVTFTANNSLNVGNLVSISGTASSTLNPSGYNYKNAIVYTGTTDSQVVLSVPGVDTETISSAGTITKIYADAGAGSASSLSSVYSKVATTEEAHGFSVGLPVDISGTGSYETSSVIILSIPSGTKFSYYSTKPETTVTSLTATLDGYRKIVTSEDHGLKPGQRFSIVGSSGQLVVEDIKDTKTFIYPTDVIGTSTGGFLTRETFSVDIDDGTAAFSGDLVSSSYKIYSLTNSGLTLTEEDGLKLTRESTQNYILNPSFSTTGSNPVPSSSQNWILTGSYAYAVANSTASDTGMGNLAGPNSLKTSAIIATAFTDTSGSSLKSVTTNYIHGFGNNDQISINYVPSGTVTPQSINARETLSGVSSTTTDGPINVFTYTPASTVNISSITGASTTKTVTTDTPHSFVTNQKVWIAGTDNTLLNNVSAVITKTGANTFTYTGASAATAQQNNSSNITSASASGTTYTYTANNTYSIGEKVTITGLNSNYNVTGDITARSGTNFVLTGTAVSPSTWNNTATVTGVLGSGSSIVYTATNAFAPGTLVTTTGLPSQYNLASAAITSSDGSSFTVSGSATGTWTKTISGITSAVSDGAGNTTYTLPAGHNITVGSKVTLSGMLGFPVSKEPLQVSALVGTTGFILADGATGTWSSGATIIDAENTGSSITYTTAATHYYESGAYVTISNMNTAYNVSNALITSASGSTFTVNTSVTPSVWGNYKIIESASGDGSTITYTTPTAHGLITNQKIIVSGTNSTYNTYPGAFTIRNTPTTNSFTIAGSATGNNWSRTVFPTTWTPTTPAAKTITAISALSSGYRTATCSAHGYPVGAVVTIAVTNPATLSEIVTITSVATNTFTYLSNGTGTFVSGGTASVTTHAVAATNTFSVGQNVTISNLPFSTTTRTVSTISALTGTYRTATTSAAHGFVPGNMISITGVTGNTALNEIITIATVPSTTTFTYVSAAAGAGASVQTGTATAINSEVQANAITVASGSSFSTTSNNSYTTRSTTYTPTNTAFSTTTAASTFPASTVLNLASVSTFPSSGSVWDTNAPREISYTGKAFGPVTISSIAAGLANATRSATVPSGHGIVVGSLVTISGVPSPNTALNTTVTVTAIGTTAFSFSIPTATTATGTISASAAFNILSGCQTVIAGALTTATGTNMVVYPTITFPIVSPATIRSPSLISAFPPSGYIKITDSSSATHIVSYTSRDANNFLGCQSIASDITAGTLKFTGAIAQQPYAVITGRRITVTGASYNATSKLITYTTGQYDPAPVVGALVSVSGFTTDTTFNISNATIRSIGGNGNGFTVYYPINSKSGITSDTTAFGVATTDTAIGKQYSAALATGSGLINSGSASVPVGVAATSLVGTASPSASGSTLTSSRISSVGSLNRPTAKTTVSLVDAADKAVTGSFWVYQNSESLGAYLNLRDFSITDGINTVQYSSNNFYSDTIPYGKWTQISKVFDLTSEWLDGPSTFKIPTGVYATRSVVISSISGTAPGTLTVTTSSNHGFTSGDEVTISGFTGNTTFNETVVISTTGGALLPSNTFTYSPGAQVSGTPTITSLTIVTGISRTDSTVYYSGVMLTMTDGLTEYFDGDHQGVWSVGRGSSISTKDSFTSGQIRLRAGSNLAVGEGNYFSELDKISFSSSLPQKVSPYVAPVSLDLYDSVLGHLPPQRGIAIYSGTDTDSKSAYIGITTDGTTGILTLGDISKIQGDAYITSPSIKKTYSNTSYYTSSSSRSTGTVRVYKTWTAPASGTVRIVYSARMAIVGPATAACIVNCITYSGTSTSGTVIVDDYNTAGYGYLCLQTGATISSYMHNTGCMSYVIGGLTPGATYMTMMWHATGGGVSGETAYVQYRRLEVEPLPYKY